MRYFNFIAALILTVVYATGKIPPSEKYNLWLITFIIPFALACNFLLLLISLLLRKKTGLYYVLSLLIGSNYLLSTVGLKYVFKKEKGASGSFSLISYNAQLAEGAASAAEFANPDSSIMEFKRWILNNDNDIQCYQEFRNYFGNINFDLVQKLKEKGYDTYFSYDSTRAYQSIISGVLIASKFPIIKAGDIISSKNGLNRIVYADILIKRDTLRIINVHLESMGLKPYNPVSISDFEEKKENTKIIFRKLKEGVFERSNQIKILVEFIKESPYPVVCAGDFNDLPYSYSYQFMKKILRNTFEEVGRGFGFTYNGNTLRTLRIDNQFYSSQLDAIDFNTLNQISFSDHFPIRGLYKLTSKERRPQGARVP